MGRGFYLKWPYKKPGIFDWDVVHILCSMIVNFMHDYGVENQ